VIGPPSPAALPGLLAIAGRSPLRDALALAPSATGRLAVRSRRTSSRSAATSSKVW